MLVVCDGVGMAYMGHPFASYLCLGVDTERLDRLRGSVWSPGGDFVFWSPQAQPGEAGSHSHVVTLQFSRPVVR